MFTKDEAKKVADFINHVHRNAEFPEATKPAGARTLTLMFDTMAAIQKKIDSNVFEVTSIEPSRKDDQ